MLSIFEAGIPANSGPINIYFNSAPQQSQITPNQQPSAAASSGPVVQPRKATHPAVNRGPNPNGLFPAMKSLWYSNYNPKNWNWNYILRGSALAGTGYGLYWIGKNYFDLHH